MGRILSPEGGRIRTRSFPLSTLFQPCCHCRACCWSPHGSSHRVVSLRCRQEASWPGVLQADKPVLASTPRRSFVRRGNAARDDEKETAFPVQQLQPLLLGRSASRCTLCRLAAGRFAGRAGSVTRTAGTLFVTLRHGWRLFRRPRRSARLAFDFLSPTEPF